MTSTRTLLLTSSKRLILSTITMNPPPIPLLQNTSCPQSVRNNLAIRHVNELNRLIAGIDFQLARPSPVVYRRDCLDTIRHPWTRCFPVQGVRKTTEQAERRQHTSTVPLCNMSKQVMFQRPRSQGQSLANQHNFWSLPRKE